ncbi:hypothetical protein [Methanobrevibacter sp.]
MPIEINEKEYKRLFNEEIDNETSWKFKSNLWVNSIINDVFEENKFLNAIVFDSEYNILKNDSNKGFLDGLIHFDHCYSVSFKKNVSRIEQPEVITGIMNFPYIQWNTINTYINKIPIEWEILILNPILMRYAEGSVGLFVTPRYADDLFIDECNSFIKLKTGFPLFLKYTNKEYVPEIHFDKPELTLESYVEEMKRFGKNRGLAKLLDFWANNDCVSVSSFEYSFKDYMENLPFSVWDSIDLKEIKSYVPFELVHEETGEILGPFNKFNLDKIFKLADTNNGVLQLNDSQIEDLIEGNYDFKLTE